MLFAKAGHHGAVPHVVSRLQAGTTRAGRRSTGVAVAVAIAVAIVITIAMVVAIAGAVWLVVGAPIVVVAISIGPVRSGGGWFVVIWALGVRPRCGASSARAVAILGSATVIIGSLILSSLNGFDEQLFCGVRE